ncbi:flippase-like domain-containing protein [Bifidobacterium pullorum subsp. saeculare]|uniref:Flippase-like domain-containing protein n=1 Tax=Bifidobacterium pullorum subsp. saeculare TaxID=78257 RepID=A0A938WWG6_9BIFI|nr:lysylphosphatidylglycerol synthase transmembrane domain-containing protein [Bifidobacterium pullorum]MBM6698848.1 flippase-like domain-containing protein [Bifidobacterium pullorum subsp. saeculare]
MSAHDDPAVAENAAACPPDGSGGVRIDDVPPHRTHDFGDLLHAAASVLLAAVIMFFATYLRGITMGVESDVQHAGHALSWLADLPASMLTQLATVAVVVSVIVHLLVGRQWAQTVAAIVAMFGGYAAAWGLSLAISAVPLPALATALLSPVTAFGSTLLPDFYAGIAAFLTAAGPRRIRATVKWGWTILCAVALLLVVLSWHSVAGVLVSLATGRFIGMLVRFAAGTENQGAWGGQVVEALRGIGLDPVSLERRHEVGEPGGSLGATLDDDLVEGSRIYDMTDRHGRSYVVSVLDSQVRAAGYLRQLWHWVRFTGMPTRRDRSTREVTQHHLGMMLGLRNAGLPTPEAYGIADTGESSILVLRGAEAMTPCNLNTLTDDDAAGLMRYLSVANRHGYTHRRIAPATLARLESGTPILAGWQNGDDASTPANVALDQVQLLALLAALIGVDRTLAAARATWSDGELASLAPFVQKAAVPAATRALAQWDKTLLAQLRDRLKALVDEAVAETMEPVTISRFSLRSFVGLALLVVAVAVVFTQLKPDEVIAAVRNANPVMALICVALGFVAWVGSAIELGAFMDRGKRTPMGLFMSQAAAGFTVVSMPAGVGPAFVNLQYLRRSGYRNTKATAIMSAVLAVYYGGTVALILLLGLFTGHNALTGMIPANTLIVVIGVLAMAAAVAMMVPPLRHLVIERLLPLVGAYVRQLADVLSQPRQLAVSVAGMLVLNLATALGFWVALLAFGQRTSLLETVFLFMLAYALGSAVPTPGGLGGVEAALTFAFAGVGVPSAVALSATLVFRVAFYWLRIPLGALAMRWLDRHNLV